MKIWMKIRNCCDVSKLLPLPLLLRPSFFFESAQLAPFAALFFCYFTLFVDNPTSFALFAAYSIMPFRAWLWSSALPWFSCRWELFRGLWRPPLLFSTSFLFGVITLDISNFSPFSPFCFWYILCYYFRTLNNLDCFFFFLFCCSKFRVNLVIFPVFIFASSLPRL